MGASKNSNFQKCGNILIDIKTIKSQDKSYAIVCGFCSAEYDQINIFSRHIEEKHLHDFEIKLDQAGAEPENSSSLSIEQQTIKMEKEADGNNVSSEKLGSPFTLREAENPNSEPICDIRNADENDVPPIKREYIEAFDEDEEFWDPQYSKRFHINLMTNSDDDMDTFQKSNNDTNEKEYPLDDETSGNSKNAGEELVVEMEPKSHKTSSALCDEDTQDTNLVTVKHLNNLKREFKHDLQRVNSEIKDQITGIRKVLTHILEEVKFSKNIVSGRPKTSLLPKLPFSSVEDFLQYETEIQNSEQKYLQLILEFELQTASCMQSFVKSIWRKLIEDGAAQFLCWKGTDKKKSVRSLSVTLALKEACVKKYGLESSNDFERCCIHHFQHAKGRFQKKLNYVPRKPTN